MGRFINADAYISTDQGVLSNNMFAYCGNSPVNKIDPRGTVPVPIIIPIIIGIGLAKNAINAATFESSDGESDQTSDSYQDEYVSRRERLDYTKQQTGESHYNFNAWRYQSEYSMHQFGWYLTGWAYEKDIPVISSLADDFSSADIYVNSWDERWYVNLATFIWGMLGF